MNENKRQLKNFRFTPELIERLENAAKLEDISQTTLVKQAIREKIAKIERKHLTECKALCL